MWISVIFDRAFRALRQLCHPQTFGIWVLVAAALVVIGPLGTYASLDFGGRMVFWGLVCSSSVVFGCLAQDLAATFVKPRASYRFDIAVILCMSLLYTPVMLLLIHSMGIDSDGPFRQFGRVLLVVFLATTLIQSLRRVYGPAPELEQSEIDARLKAPEPAKLPVSPTKPPNLNQDCRLRNRLPPTVTGKILHLSARDHFVDVSLEGTLYTLRMRFADAVAEMDGVDGFHIHRSHWVARDAVATHERDNGKIHLVLHNGSQVPVSRNAKARLEEEGVI